MELVDALAWLDRRVDHEATSSGIAAGAVDGLNLDVMSALMALLGDPQHDVPVIHVTGTNGKGTVVEMISALLRAHGLSVGTYTSPHQHHLRERIRRDGEPISDADLAEVLSGIAAVEPLLEATPSWFEVVTAAALRWFAEAPVDVAVVEVGLLGRYDATNVVDAAVAVVTNVGGDHTDFAPGWELAVAGEKAGIITPDCTAVIGPMPDELAAVFDAEGPASMRRVGHDLRVTGDRIALGGHVVDVSTPLGEYHELYVPCHGEHQVTHVATALGAVEAFFGRAVPVEVAEEALAAVELPGRCEVVAHSPLVVLDGAHNPDALAALVETLDAEFSAAGSRLVVVGLLAGRDPVAALEALGGLRADLFVCTTPDGGRGLPAEELAAAASRMGLPNEVVADPGLAVARAVAVAADEDLVVVTGSFRLLAPARAVLVP